jgi:hypothetical protein
MVSASTARRMATVSSRPSTTMTSFIMFHFFLSNAKRRGISSSLPNGGESIQTPPLHIPHDSFMQLFYSIPISK